MALTFYKTRIMQLIPALLLLICCLSACKPSTKNETAKWQSNLSAIDKLVQDAPAFAVPIKEVKAKAEAAWAEAEKMTEEEKKAEGMNVANQMISNGFVGHLIKIPEMEKEIDDIRGKLAGKTMAQSLIAKINDELDNTNKAYELYDTALDKGAADEVSANANVEPAYSALSASLSKWKSLYDEYKRGNDAKKKKK